MAPSNRDRIGKMFDLMSPPLDAFISRVVAPEIGADTDWAMLVQLKDKQQRGASGKAYSRTDPHVQLRMLSENVTGQVKQGWFPFNSVLSHAQKGFATELRDVRNAWAHGGAFSTDDTYRALDTAERLMKAIDAPEAADEIERLRKDVRRLTAEAEDRRVVKELIVASGSDRLSPWREVLEPHRDVAEGNFRASEFAADLYKVSTGDPDQSREYADPAEFFARTYLTDGLRDLITRSVARLFGDMNAPPVINLQTNFGGGKTHSMLALWHLAAGRPTTEFVQDVQELLASGPYARLVENGVRRVALVGNHLAPSGETKPDGTKVNTMWGELAWQLGGADAYEIVAESDRTSTAPGKALHELLAAYAPAVILIDEWVAYARQLYDRDDLVAGSFDTQFTFAQSLTEAVKATAGVLVAISIPASHDPDGGESAGVSEEVGGANGQEALRRLQNVVRRVADQWQPASSDEAYEIVRRRLFVEPDPEALAAIGKTAKEFVEFYRKHSTDFPREARETDYEDRIRRSYPIHPELFDRLYEDWSTLERFQRTRGVLRLMNTVIHELWIGGDASPLIMPGSIPLSGPEVKPELTQYLGDAWKPIIDADVDGPHSVPVSIDGANNVFGQRSITRRLARTVFFGAAPTIGSAQKGLETQRVFLGTAVPGDVPGNFHSALTNLSDRATYFYSGAGKFWYDTQANITRRAKDQADRLHVEDVWAEVVRRLADQRRTPGAFASVHVAPEDSGDIVDLDEARLVIVHPRADYSNKSGQESSAHVFARQATERRGSANRTYRNMVVFLAADHDRMIEVDAAVREFLGWKSVYDGRAELDLTGQQIRQAEERRDRANHTANDRILGAYTWMLVPEQPDGSKPFVIAADKVDAQSSALAERVSRKLGNEGSLSTERGAYLIRLDLESHLSSLWEHGHVRVGDLWSAYATYPYMPRLRDRSVLDAGIRSALGVLVWQAEGFAVAEDFDETTGVYGGLAIPDPSHPPVVQITDNVLLVRADVAEAQRVQTTDDETEPDSGDFVVQPDGGAAALEEAGVSRRARKTRFFGTRTLDPQRYAADFRKISDEVVAHLAAADRVKLTVRLEIEATTPDGFDEARVRTVSENANTLKFDESGFEES